MLAIIGAAILVGLFAGGVALHFGSSILMAFGAYVLFGSLFLLAVILGVWLVNVAKDRFGKESHAYSG